RTDTHVRSCSVNGRQTSLGAADQASESKAARRKSCGFQHLHIVAPCMARCDAGIVSCGVSDIWCRVRGPDDRITSCGAEHLGCASIANGQLESVSRADQRTAS